MKELYLDAEMEVVEFDVMDVITTSGGEGGEGGEGGSEGGEGGGAGEETTTSFVPTDNEGEGDWGAWD